MTANPKKIFLLNAGMTVITVLGLYLTATLFEIWALLPFWVKNVSLILSLALIYLVIRQGLGKSTRLSKKLNPALMVASAGLTGLVILGIIQAGPALPGRIVQALTFSLDQPPAEVLVTLEITPPAYTGEAPQQLLAFEDGPVTRIKNEEQLFFPEGSIITLNIQMEENTRPVISLANEWARATQDEDGVFTAQQILKEAGTLDIQVGPYVSISQRLGVNPDENPAIAFNELPITTARQSLKFSADFQDDFGVEEIFLELRGSNIEPDLIQLPFLKASSDNGSSEFYVNLLDHKRAGTKVTAKLVAVDGLGQRAESEEKIFDLPEKEFKNEAAIEVFDIRRALILNPDRATGQQGRIEDLAENPDRFGGSTSVYLALRSAYWRLRSAETLDDVEEISRFLWQTALTLESDGSSEEQNLRALLDEMTEITLRGGDIREFEQTAVLLRTKANSLFREEFGQTRRRFSFNAGVSGFELPQIGNFRELTRVLEREATENNRENVLKALLEARALFEDVGELKNRSRRPGS